MLNLEKQKITIKCQSRDFLKRYYEIVGGLFPGYLSDKEREIIEAFYQFGGTITTNSRSKVADHLKTSVLNINNYLSRLRKKGAVVMDSKGEDDMRFHPILLPTASAMQNIPLSFVFIIDHENQS